MFVKVYAIGLYLPERKTTSEDIQALAGPRRVSLYIQREINSDEFGQLFITSMNKNSNKDEKAKVIGQTMQFGEMFASLPPVKGRFGHFGLDSRNRHRKQPKRQENWRNPSGRRVLQCCPAYLARRQSGARER